MKALLVFNSEQWSYNKQNSRQQGMEMFYYSVDVFSLHIQNYVQL